MKKILILAVFSLTLYLVQAQDASRFVFQHVALAVADVDRSAAFYQDIFGFTEIENRSQTPGIRWFSMGPGLELHLIQTDTEAVQVIKHVHMAWSTPDFMGFLDLLEARGLEYSDWPGTRKGDHLRADGVKQVYFQDPDGYWIELNDEYK